MKNTNILYERLKGKGNIAKRAWNILTKNEKVNSVGNPYSLQHVYLLAKKPGSDAQVDLAILEACEAYLSEIEESKVAVKEKEQAVLKRMEAVLS